MTDTSARRSKRPGLAAVLSAVVPGAGQWYGGRIRRAVLLFLPTVVLVSADGHVLVSGHDADH